MLRVNKPGPYKLVEKVKGRSGVTGTAFFHENWSETKGARLGRRRLQLRHHAMASEGKHLVRVRMSAAVAFAALLIRTELRSGVADRGRNRVQGMTRCLAHEVEASENLELSQQGRDMKFYCALGEIQFVGDFLVGKAAKDAIEDFFFAAGQANGIFGAVSRFEKFLGFFGQAVQSSGSGWNHHEIILGGLAAHQAMHGEQAGGVIHGEFPAGSGLNVKMGRARTFFIKQIDAGLSRVLWLR